MYVFFDLCSDVKKVQPHPDQFIRISNHKSQYYICCNKSNAKDAADYSALIVAAVVVVAGVAFVPVLVVIVDVVVWGIVAVVVPVGVVFVVVVAVVIGCCIPSNNCLQFSLFSDTRASGTNQEKKTLISCLQPQDAENVQNRN